MKLARIQHTAKQAKLAKESFRILEFPKEGKVELNFFRTASEQFGLNTLQASYPLRIECVFHLRANTI